MILKIIRRHSAYQLQLAAPVRNNMTGNAGKMGVTSEACKRCGVVGSDLKILDCGCHLHVVRVPIHRIAALPFT